MTTSESKLSQLRLLILSPSQGDNTEPRSPKPSPFAPLLEILTSTAPSPDLPTFAGYTSHQPIPLKTKYYEKDVSIWCDELPPAILDTSKASSQRGSEDAESEDTRDDLAQWQEQMTSEPAREVRDVIGGIVLLLPFDSRQMASPKLDEHLTVYFQAVHHLRDIIEDESGGRDIASCVVLQPADPAATSAKEPGFLKQLEDFSAKLEEWCHDEAIFGWDFVPWDARVETSKAPADDEKNIFGEKVGIDRIKEVLEAVDWGAGPALGLEDSDLAADGPDVFSGERFKGLDAELQQEMMGLKLSMMDGKDSAGQKQGEDMSSDQMQDLMQRVVAIRDAGVELPPAERQAFAKREVEKIIRELS